MKNFFRRKWIRIISIIVGVFIFLILLWYLFGDNLFLSFLKTNSEQSPCHEDCMAQRAMINAGLIYLSENRPWTTNKVKQEILNQKESGKYRALVLNVYRQILGEGVSFPQEVLNLLNNSKTPAEVKEAIISLSSDLEPTADMINQWKTIVVDENQGVDARVAAIRKLGNTKNEEFAPFLLDIVKNTKEGRVQFEGIIGVQGITKNKELGQEVINRLEDVFSDKTIHSSIRRFILDVFAHSKSLVLGKVFILQAYNNYNNDKFIRYRAAEELNYLATGDIFAKLYLRPEISDKEWDEYINSQPY